MGWDGVGQELEVEHSAGAPHCCMVKRDHGAAEHSALAHLGSQGNMVHTLVT
jgi:hypothetical protein